MLGCVSRDRLQLELVDRSIRVAASARGGSPQADVLRRILDGGLRPRLSLWWAASRRLRDQVAAVAEARFG